MTERLDVPRSQDPGDDSVVARLYVTWLATVRDVTRSETGTVGTVHRTVEDVWELVFAVDRGQGRRQRHFIAVDPYLSRKQRWPLIRLGPGIWDIPVSIHIPGQLHAFVTLIRVPDLAPWEV